MATAGHAETLAAGTRWAHAPRALSFRDETEGLRARIRELEGDVRTARAERDDAVEKLSDAKKSESSARALAVKDGAGKVVRVVAILGITVGGFFAAGWLLDDCSGCTVTSLTGGLSATATPTAGMLDLDVTPDPASVELVASGDTSAPSECRGYLPGAPQLVIRSSRRVALRIAPTSIAGGDLVAAVLTADGQLLCDDDGGGSLNPLVVGVVPPGDTRVWVGTYSSGDSIPFRLAVHADVAEPPVASGAPATLAGPGLDAHGVYAGSFTTVMAASNVAPECRGYVPADPALTLMLTEPSAVRLDATGEDDLVLLVREPDHHVKCDDDSGPGFSPRIAAMLPAGEHLVYVGTYSESGRAAAYTLVADVVRVDPLAPATLGVRALGAPGESVVVEGHAEGTISAAALGATCPGGLLPAAPQVDLDLAAAADVVFSIASATQPLVVIAHEDRTFECVRTGHTRLALRAGRHRVYVGIGDESVEADFVLTTRTEPSTLRPWP